MNRLIKLSDANAERLNNSNTALDRLSKNLSRFVTQTIADGLKADNNTDVQQVKRAELTVFFSDIVGFTQMSERLEPEQLAQLMGAYFAEMTEICNRWGGTLDQFIGDAIVIFFGDPISAGTDDDAVNAVNMALEMQQRLVALREKWAANGPWMEIHVRMGLSSGFCSVGNFGSSARLHYTALGNVVNEAARLQDKCPIDKVMIAETTYRRVRDRVKCQKGAHVSLAGRRHPVQLYEALAEDTMPTENHLVIGNDDGFRLHLDCNKLSDPQRVRVLLETALASLSVNSSADPKTRP